MNLHDENGKLVNFCVPLTGSDEDKRNIAIEVIDKSVEMGANFFEGVCDHHDKAKATYDPKLWNYIGNNDSCRTIFADARKNYGDSSLILTFEDFRTYYDKWRSDQWPDDDSPRNQAVGQNGNTAEHYDEQEIRKLGCFGRVADVIGDEAAIRELRLIEDWEDKTSCFGGAFIWGTSPQGLEFWHNIDDGVNPYDNQKAEQSKASNAHDNVTKPSHYQLMPGVEVKDVREAILNNAPDGIPYNQIDDWSRAWEYLTRMWGKNGLEDAKKARVYLDWLIDKMEKAE